MCITQFKPLENGDYESVLKRPLSTSNITRYKPKKHEFCSEPLSRRGSEEVFHVYHTNQTLGKRGLGKWTIHPPSTSNNENYKPKKHEITTPAAHPNYNQDLLYNFHFNFWAMGSLRFWGIAKNSIVLFPSEIFYNQSLRYDTYGIILVWFIWITS